jgi:hypothetical protein
MDFLQDALASGRKLRTLSVEDAYTREMLVIEMDTSLPSLRAVCGLESFDNIADCRYASLLTMAPNSLRRPARHLRDLAPCARNDPVVVPFLGRAFHATASFVNSSADTKSCFLRSTATM